MIDPMVAAAFSVYSNKGADALLLGSGISRASGIPTGWEVVLDLVRKIARLEDEDCEPDPAVWYQNKYGAEPDYSKLLNDIAKTQTQRQQLLLGYFEPVEELCSVIYPDAVLHWDQAQLLPGMERHHTPVSDYLFAKLREPLREYLPRDEDYEVAFDRFEYFVGLVHASLNSRVDKDSWWGPHGRFLWKGGNMRSNIGKEIDDQGIN